MNQCTRTMFMVLLCIGLQSCRSRSAPPNGPPQVHSTTKTFRGRIEERLPAGPYAYVRISVPGDVDQWVVTMGAGAEPGRSATVKAFGERTGFYSRRLKRTFESLWFGLIETESPILANTQEDPRRNQ